MFTKDMSYEEIAKVFVTEYNKYFRSMYQQACAANESILKNPRKNERVWYKPYKSYHEGIHYIITFYTRALSEPEFDNVNFIWYGWFYIGDNAYAICFHTFHTSNSSKTTQNVSIFIPHFFCRYNERFLKDPKLMDYEVIHRYFLNNCIEGFKYVPSKKYPNSIYNLGNDGISFSNFDNPICFEFKTFVSWGMLYPDQKKIALEVKMKTDVQGLDLAIPADEFENDTSILD